MEGESEAAGRLDLRAFGGDVLVYSLGNGLLFLFGLIQLFIIPRYLSAEGYGYWQLFMLYASYGGLLHLGFINGIHVRWAGKELAQVGDEIKTAFRFLLLEQLALLVPLGWLLYFLLHPPFQWLGLMVLLYALILNLASFFSWTAMAIRKFKLLTAVNVSRGLLFLLLVILIFVSRYLDYHYVVFAFLAASLLPFFVLAFWFRKYLWGEKPAVASLWACGSGNIKIGIFVLLGNLVVTLFLSIDRLMVSRFFPIEQFAIYAFALTVAMIAYTFVQAVFQVFFPYLSGVAPELRSRAYQLGKPTIILLWAASLALYFPLTRLVQFYLPNYVSSLPILRLLLCTVGFGSLIQVLHVSYYMVYRQQRRYFFWGVMALALSAILNLVAIKVWGTLESVATAMIISFAVWYIINELSLRSVIDETIKKLWEGLAILISYLGAFWLASFAADWFITQMLIYIGFASLLTWLLLRSEIRELVMVTRGLRSKHLM